MKVFQFNEFEVNSATVQTPTQSTDDMLGVSNSWSTKTSVGASGIITGSLQALSGQRMDDLQARFAAYVDYVFYPTAGQTNLAGTINGDRLYISSKLYDILYVYDETDVGLAYCYYLKRID